ncbi:MAG: c-type cytochrome [Terriglobales bacterium]
MMRAILMHPGNFLGRPATATRIAFGQSISRLVLLIGLLIIVSPSVFADEIHNPFSGDPKAAKAGEFEFRINCAFCHGLGARGGGRGPDLTRAHKRHGDSDADLFQNISQGIPGTVMPANGTNGQGVGMTDEEIWQIITYLRSIQVQSPAKPVGNAAHGRELFYGDANCSSCHMVEGNGGRLGPDLTAVGTARTVDSLVESVRNPSKRLAWGLTEPTKEFAQEYQTVTVVTPDGHEIKGVTLNEDQFSLQMMDTAEHIHLFEKDKLRSIQKSRESLMPVYTPALLSDQDLDDIIAFLLSGGAK